MIYLDTGRVAVRDTVGSDIVRLRDRLRPKDAEEVIAAGAVSVADALARDFAASVMRHTVELDGLPVAVFGLEPDTVLGESACVWFLGAPELAQMKKTFVRATGPFIAKFLEAYPVLYNYVDARYTETVRWLEAFGARFDPPAPFGPRGVPFRRFVIRRA